nr:hypothetical protein fc124 [uncultured bacterium]
MSSVADFCGGLLRLPASLISSDQSSRHQKYSCRCSSVRSTTSMSSSCHTKRFAAGPRDRRRHIIRSAQRTSDYAPIVALAVSLHGPFSPVVASHLSM